MSNIKELIRDEIRKWQSNIEAKCPESTSSRNYTKEEWNAIYEYNAYTRILSFLDTLEEPVGKTCKTCGFYENNCPFIRGKFISYPNKVCKDYTFSTLKAEQEPVSEDLEEELERRYEQAKWGYVDGFGETVMDKEQFTRIARHFAEWGAGHTPLPEDTVIFQKGVAEGRRLEREDALTIADIEKLHTFLYAVKNNKLGAFTFTRLSDEQYGEVLRRFNKTKEQ